MPILVVRLARAQISLRTTSVHPEATKGGRRDVRQLQPEGSSTEGRGGIKDMSPEGAWEWERLRECVNFKGLGEGIQHQPLHEYAPRDRAIATGSGNRMPRPWW